jgi:hypothetical protein
MEDDMKPQLKMERDGSWSFPKLNKRSALILLIALLFVMVTTAVAQENEPADGPVPYVPDGVEVARKVIPYGIEAQVNISANHDAFISSLHPNSNYGTWTTMGLGWQNSTYNAMRMLMEFNLSAIPSNAIISNAEIFVYQNSSNPSNDSPMGFKAQYMKSQWSETGVTWNNANYLGGTEIGVGELSNALGWKSGNVTDMVERWYSGAQSNYGLIMTGDEGPQNNRSRFLRSRQWSGYAPYIKVTYTSCSDTAPPTTSMQSLPNWSPGSFTVKWSAQDGNGTGIAWYDVQYRINGGSWVEWKHQTTSTSATFSGASMGQVVEFRARAADNCHNLGNWSSTVWTQVDTQAPVAKVNSLPQYTFTPNFIVTWDGTDNGSGLAAFDVQYRNVSTGGNWINWQNDTTNTSAQFTGAQNGTTYEYRARGIDNVGNEQSWGPTQAFTTTFFEPIGWILPFPSPTTTDNPFPVMWTGATPGGTISYDIYVRFQAGAWVKWLSDTSATQADYTPASGNGLYEFAAIAKNSLGQSEPFNGQPEQPILYNSDSNAFQTTYFPYFNQTN